MIIIIQSKLSIIVVIIIIQHGGLLLLPPAVTVVMDLLTRSILHSLGSGSLTESEQSGPCPVLGVGLAGVCWGNVKSETINYNQSPVQG